LAVIALFGATGRTGQLVLDRTLANGHKVRALMHDPAKLPTHTDALAVVVGEVLLEPLRPADLVAVTANPHNCRSRVLSLTKAARAEVERFEQRVVEEVAPIFDDLSDQELKDLADLLGRLGNPR
jgi:hypothetical protein